MSNFTVYSRQHPRVTGNWQAHYEPHSFSSLEGAESYLNNPDLDYNTCMGIHCNFNPGGGMNAGIVRNGTGGLRILFGDGGDGGCSDLVPLLKFIARTMPDLYREAANE